MLSPNYSTNQCGLLQVTKLTVSLPVKESTAGILSYQVFNHIYYMHPSIITYVTPNAKARVMVAQSKRASAGEGGQILPETFLRWDGCVSHALTMCSPHRFQVQLVSLEFHGIQVDRLVRPQYPQTQLPMRCILLRHHLGPVMVHKRQRGLSQPGDVNWR